MKLAEVEKMAGLYSLGYSCGEIAAVHKISRQAVYGRLVRHGVLMRDKNGKPRRMEAEEPTVDEQTNAVIHSPSVSVRRG